MTVYDVRLVGPEDPQNVGAYPLLRSIDTPLSQYCMACQAETGTSGLINYKDTKTKCRDKKILPCKL